MGVKQEAGRERREVILDELRKAKRELGFVPSLRDLSARTGVPLTSLMYHLDSLRDQGYVTWVEGHRARSTDVTSKSKAHLK